MKLNVLLFTAAVSAMAVASPALADSVPGLYSTGVDTTGAPQANGSDELHYSLVSAPEGVLGIRVATSANGYPFPYWNGDNNTSAWVGPNTDQSLDGPVGTYDYRTTFSLAGFNAATAALTGVWATDDSGVDILLNGMSTGNVANGFSSFTPFSITSGFAAGVNTLDFIVYNSGGPTGLRTDQLNLTANVMSGAGAVPEPATWAMMMVGFGMIGFGLRRRSKVTTSVRFA